MNKNNLKTIIDFYESGLEKGRLDAGTGQLERERTFDLLERHLPPPPKVIMDIGGANGIYACWLAKKGYEVHLIDPVPLHIRQAEVASKQQADHPIATCRIGDARDLDFQDKLCDAALLFGPLYHLVRRDDRLKALTEACRVLKKGGLLFAVTISRFASLLDGLVSGFLEDPDFARIVEQDLKNGQHRNPTDNPVYWTDAYFHHPDEIAREIEDTGFEFIKHLPVEGPAWLLGKLQDYWRDDEWRERLLKAVRSIENEPSMMGVSAHILSIARKNE